MRRCRSSIVRFPFSTFVISFAKDLPLPPLSFPRFPVSLSLSLSFPPERLFPFKEMFDWLSYGNTGDVARDDPMKKDYFLRREWSMTLEGDIYLRYKSYADQDTLARDIRRNKPIKIDIGAVYSAPPRDKAQLGSSFAPVERELVFDIDMDDYDDVRNCW
jgi:DNA primase small subunit